MNTTSVLLVTPRWTRDGGIATHVMASAAALAASGSTVSVAAARIESAASVAGVELIHAPRLFDPDASPESRLGEALASAPEVIHAHQFDDPEAVAFMRRTAPVLLSAHGYTACTSGAHFFRPGQECARPHGPGCAPHLALRRCVHTRHARGLPAAYARAGRSLEALRAADVAISYSSAVDRHLATNGIDRRRVIPLFPTIVAHAGGSGHGQRRRVLFAGRIIATKGVEVLIRAAREVDGEFVICGDGWRLAAARRLAERSGVAERVSFRDWIEADRLAYELAEASVIAMPSVWPEPFGLVGIEAFAAGRPVIASDTGGVRDWLRHDVNGLCVKPGDPRALAQALGELLADPARQRQMGLAGKKLVQARFSAERHVSALLAAYRIARSARELDRAPA